MFPSCCSYFTFLFFSCRNATSNLTHATGLCYYDYNGQGLEYQIVAGPAFTVIYTFGGIFISYAAEKYNRKAMLAACLMFWSVMTLLTGFVKEYWQLVILRFGLGFGYVCFINILSFSSPELMSFSNNWCLVYICFLSFKVEHFMHENSEKGYKTFLEIVMQVMGVAQSVLSNLTYILSKNSQFWKSSFDCYKCKWSVISFESYLCMFLLCRESGCGPFAVSILTDYFTPETRGFALGIYNWGIYFGYSMSYAFGNFISLANINGQVSSLIVFVWSNRY